MMTIPTLTPEQIRGMGNVRRWHTRPVNKDQNLLEHSAAVAMLALHLAGDRLDALDELDLLKLALFHDSHETRFGDIPYPAKAELAKGGHDLDGHCRWIFWNSQDPYDQVSPDVRSLVEAADVLEAALWARDHAPEVADAVAAQALASARNLLDRMGVLRVMKALGMDMEETLP